MGDNKKYNCYYIIPDEKYETDPYYVKFVSYLKDIKATDLFEQFKNDDSLDKPTNIEGNDTKLVENNIEEFQSNNGGGIFDIVKNLINNKNNKNMCPEIIDLDNESSVSKLYNEDYITICVMDENKTKILGCIFANFLNDGILNVKLLCSPKIGNKGLEPYEFLLKIITDYADKNNANIELEAAGNSLEFYKKFRFELKNQNNYHALDEEKYNNKFKMKRMPKKSYGGNYKRLSSKNKTGKKSKQRKSSKNVSMKKVPKKHPKK